MISEFAGVGHLTALVRIALGSQVSQQRVKLIAERMWERGVRSMSELCIDEEFFKLSEYCDMTSNIGGLRRIH